MVKAKRVSEGAEAEIYPVEFAEIPAIIKDRVKKEYRVEKLDTEIRSRRTRSEAKIIARASENGTNVPFVLMTSGNRIFISKIEGRTFNLLSEKEKTSEIFGEAGRQLALLHSADVVHGDYTPANLMLDKKGKVWIIDFGLGEITNSIEEKALDLLLMKRSINKGLYGRLEKEYSKNYSASKEVLNQLKEIERRGRYQTRTLTAAR